MIWLFVASTIALWIIAFLLSVLMIGTLRQLGVVNSRLGSTARPYVGKWGLELGAPVASFSLLDVVSGRRHDFDASTARPTVLIFVAPTCTTCRKLLDTMPTRIDEFDPLLITSASLTAAAEWARREGFPALLLDEGSELASVLKAQDVTPFATAVVHGAVAAKGVVNHWDEILALVRHATGGHREHAVSEIPLDRVPAEVTT